MSIVAADESGNIAYFLLASAPKRGKTNDGGFTEVPYVGCNVLDGTFSKYDW